MTIIPICPECEAGKHWNCNGVGGVDDTIFLNPIPCVCQDSAYIDHPARKPIVDSDGGTLFDWTDEYWFKVENGIITYEHRPRPEIPDLDKVPDDVGLETAAFPELSDEKDLPWDFNFRMRPDAEIIKDFHDVEIMNSKGVWVPAIPYPIHLWFGIKQCHCGKRRFGDKRYQEHYAYAHIMGMED